MAENKKILVVEDEEDMRDLVAVRLEVAGFDVLQAEDGEVGLKMIREQKPNLVVLDLMIPKLDGFEVCRMVKFDDQLKKIPIVILSAMTQQRDREKAIEYGADAYFIKPFDLGLLITKIKELTSG